MTDTLAEYQAIADSLTRDLRLPRVLIEWKHRNNDCLSNRGYYLPGADLIRLNSSRATVDTLLHELAHHVGWYRHENARHDAIFKAILAEVTRAHEAHR